MVGSYMYMYFSGFGVMLYNNVGFFVFYDGVFTYLLWCLRFMWVFFVVWGWILTGVLGMIVVVLMVFCCLKWRFLYVVGRFRVLLWVLFYCVYTIRRVDIRFWFFVGC